MRLHVRSIVQVSVVLAQVITGGMRLRGNRA
jgi:hypothetical protein